MLLYVFLYGVDDHRNLHVLTLSSPTRRSSDLLAERGSSLVITVDCGAMAFEALEQARKAGLDVIVVDHHKCAAENPPAVALVNRSEEHTSELQSLMRISYAVFGLKKKTTKRDRYNNDN